MPFNKSKQLALRCITQSLGSSLCCFPLKLSHNKLLTHGGPVTAVNLIGNFPSDP